MSVSGEFSMVVKPMAAQGLCGACKFLAVLSNGQTLCKRFPPAVAAYATPPGAGASVWPPVSLDDWCGEYQPAPAVVSK